MLDRRDRLPGVQARALEGALALGPPGAGRSAGGARRGARAAVGGGGRTARAALVDDAHWLDDASADALLFIARRLEGEPIALVLALRPVEGRRLDLAGVETLAVEASTRAEAAELLREPVDRAGVVERLHDATAGNPLALLEAHVRAGDPERAEAALREFEAMAVRTRRPWVLATAARCRGLLADDFDPWFERAYEAHGASASPFEIGRTELCHGERLRRARRVLEARERLRSALERFEALGAAPWAARARAELRAAGAPVGAPRALMTRDLTPQELEVALAVGRGATNREVAAALYVSPKTIEVHLSRIFRKLGVRSAPSSRVGSPTE